MAKRYETIERWRVEGLLGIDLDMNVTAKGRPWRVHVYPLRGSEYEDTWCYKKISFEGQEKAKERFDLFRNNIAGLLLEDKATAQNIWEAVDGELAR